MSNFTQMDFDRLAARHKDAVYRQLLRVCGNHEDTEDALVEALMRAYKAYKGLRSEDAFRAWLIAIGRRVCIRLRKRDLLLPVLDLAELDLESLPSGDSTQEKVERDELKGCVSSALASLPEIYREVYLLREIEEIPAEDVAQKLGLSVAAVKSRLHRARALVRQSLDRDLCCQDIMLPVA